MTFLATMTGYGGVGSHAFYGCSNLATVTFLSRTPIPLASGAFGNCSALVSISGPLSVQENASPLPSCLGHGLQRAGATSPVTSSGAQCIPCNVAHLVIPPHIATIGDSAFADCPEVETITFPNSVTSIGQQTFDGATGLKRLNLPDSLTNLGDYAFRGARLLQSFTLPATVRFIQSLGYQICLGCESLRWVYAPRSVRAMPFGFPGCDSPNASAPIDGNISCFFLPPNSTALVIPDTVTSIAANAFSL